MGVRRASTFTIGELSRRTGASIKALRLYDSLGLLTVLGRSATNYRLFDETAIDCVAAIRRLRAAGLSLRDMRDLVQAHEAGGLRVQHLEEKLREVLERTETQATRLEQSRRALAELLALAASAAPEADLTHFLSDQVARSRTPAATQATIGRADPSLVARR